MRREFSTYEQPGTATRQVEVAVVGIGLRFPPATVGAEAFWSFLQNRGDAVREVPADRWSSAAFYDSDPAKPSRMDVARGAFLDQRIEEFDAAFFGISPREAAQLDPQQRLLMEVSWEAFEDAGCDVWRMRGSRTGVYVGAFMLDNLLQRAAPGTRHEIGPQTALTCTNTVLASRLAYFYDLRGPAMAIDTACSSSLVAVHQAVRALASSECDIALAGGVNRIFRPEASLMMSKGRYLAPDGRSKSFSINGDGYGRGEGCGLVVLKRLADAVADGDRVYAVVERTGVNQDGRTGGPAMPSSEAQATLAADVAASAGVDPATIAFVEAHGTGTAVGDPAEMSALGDVIGRAVGRVRPCVVGSVKAGIGHLEGAAGVAGFVKAALVAGRGVVPPQAWLDEPNPDLDLERRGLEVATEPVDLVPHPGAPLRVAVNSFGYGGTNAHAILREPPNDSPAAADPAGFFPPVALVSGHTEGAVAAVADDCARLLRRRHDRGGPEFGVLAAFAGRTAHEHRRAVVGDPSAFADLLRDVGNGRSHPDVMAGRAPGNRVPEPVFVFSGMGPQWWGMARALLTGHDGFRAHAERCDRAFSRLAGWSVVDALLAPEDQSRMASTEVAQPANVVLQTGLVEVLAELGIIPCAVLGHSVGEVAAAYAAGCLDVEGTMTVVYHRSRLQATTAGTGSMLATDLPQVEAQVLADAHGPHVSVAAVNAPHATTLAGDVRHLEQIAAELEARNSFARLLRVEVPYHSPAMDGILRKLRDALADLSPSDGRLRRYSTVDVAFDDAAWDGEYWGRNVRDTVAFHAAATRAAADGHRVFVEIGPHPVLALYLKQMLSTTREATVVATLHRERPDPAALVDTAARLWLRGLRVDWTPVLGRNTSPALPAYPWQREEHWQESAATRQIRTGQGDHPDLLHGRPTGVRTWDIDLSPTALPWLRDHQVDGEAVFPATGYLDVAVSHARARAEGALPVALENLRIERPLVLPLHDDPTLRVVEGPDGQVEFLAGRAGDGPDGGRRVARARLGRGRYAPPSPAPDPGGRSVDNEVGTFYRSLSDLGLHYEGDFRAVTGWRVLDGRGPGDPVAIGSTVLIDVCCPGDLPGGYTVYPPLLDAALHGAIGVLLSGTDRLFVPVSISRVVVHGELPDSVVARATLQIATAGRIRGDVEVRDATGGLLVLLQGIELRGVARRTAAEVWADERSYEVRWEGVDLPIEPDARRRPTRWLVNGGSDLVTALRSAATLQDHRSGDGPAATPGDDGHPVVVEEVPSAGDLPARVGIDDDDAVGVVVDLRSVPSGDVRATTAAASQVLHLVQALSAAPRARPTEVMLVTAAAVAAIPEDTVDGWATGWATGFRRTAANELGALTVRHVDVAQRLAEDGAERSLETLGRAALQTSDEELAVRAGELYRPVVQRITTQEASDAWWQVAPSKQATEVEDYALTSTGRSLQDLKWVSGHRRAPKAHEIELRILAVGLNYKDVLKQLGLLSDEALARTHIGTALGMEQCAVVERVGSAVRGYAPGDRVVAGLSGGFRRFVTLDPAAALLLPARPDWTDAEAAGLLVSFLTAHAVLAELARVQQGESVLIHGATGGFGQAALQVARHLGAAVLATASTDDKRGLAAALGAERTFDSRSLDFVDAIRAETGGRGVDVVVNTLPGDGLRAALDVAAEGGRVVEIGKREVVEGGTLPLDLFDRNLTFTSFDLDQLARDRDRFLALGGRVLDRFAAGDYHPVATTAVRPAEVADAMGRIARAEHVGKLVVAMGDVVGLECREPAGEAGPVGPGRWYVITGGTGGVGREVARWLASRGACHIALLSRRGVLGPEADLAVDELREAGVEVRVLAADVADRKALDPALQQLRDTGVPIAGIVHAAGIAHDLPLTELSGDDLELVFQPKLVGARNLHDATCGDPIDLFLLTSSVSTLTGTTGQGPYVAANATIEAFAQWRRSHGLPAAALSLGPVADVGMAALTHEIARYVKLYGFEPLPVEHLGVVLDRATSWNRPVLGIFDMDWSSWEHAEPHAAASHRFAGLLAHTRQVSGTGSTRAQLAALSEDERIHALARLVADALATVLGADDGTVASDAPLAGLGLDSLMLIELQTHLNGTLGADLSLMGLLGIDTVHDAARRIDERLRTAV